MFESLRDSFKGAFGLLRGSHKLTEENLTEAVRMVRRALMEADVNAEVAKQFANTVKAKAVGQELIGKLRPEEQFVKIVNDELIELMSPPEGHKGLTLPGGPTVLMMVGLNGAGKTTTTAKLALHLRKKEKKEVLLVAADLARPAAIDQLQSLGDQLQIPVHRPTDPSATSPPKACLDGIARAKKEGFDVVILDTAGRMEIDETLMQELEQVKKKVKPHHTLLVVDGMLGQAAANSAKVFNERLEATGVIVSKLDGDTRGGAALSVRHVTGKPILFIGTGEKPTDLDPFRPKSIADQILGMGDIVKLAETVQEHIQQDEAEEQLYKVLEGQFTLEDFLNQLQMISKMGSFKSLLGMMPQQLTGALGVSPDQLDQFDESEIKYTRAIIQSMTQKERRFPDVIDANRKRRIAKGSGTEVTQINDLLKSFQQMQKQFSAMKGSNSMLGRMAAGAMTKQKKKMLAAERKEKQQRRKLKRK